MADSEEEKAENREVKSVLRELGYRVPESEEEVRELRRAFDMLLGIVATKRTMGTKAWSALAWTVVAALTGAVLIKLWGAVGAGLEIIAGGS